MYLSLFLCETVTEYEAKLRDICVFCFAVHARLWCVLKLKLYCSFWPEKVSI